jgi:hypothetical protein
MNTESSNSTLVTLAFDRMKSIELLDLHEQLSNSFKTIDAKKLHLEWAFEFFKALNVPAPKSKRSSNTFPQTKALNIHYKAIDNLMCALKLQCKALIRADFKDTLMAATTINSILNQKIKYDIHDSQNNKINRVALFFHIVRNFTKCEAYLEMPEIKPYIEAIRYNYQKIKELKTDKMKYKAANAPGSTLKDKREFIKGMQTFLSAYKLAIIQHPELDYSRITSIINYAFISSRAQLRNRATRRLRKGERLKLESDGEGGEGL